MRERLEPPRAPRRPPGPGSIALERPALLTEWNRSRNGQGGERFSILAEDVVWWRCFRGHEWQAAVKDRANGQGGCPFCSGEALPHAASLAGTHPELAAEWHATKNGAIEPHQITASSIRFVWWRCKNEHEWQSRVVDRVKKGHACRACGAARSQSTKTVADTPDLMAQWHTERNANVNPASLPVSSTRRVWWRCTKGDHEWMGGVAYRLRGGSCPYCQPRMVVQPALTPKPKEPATVLEATKEPKRRGPKRKPPPPESLAASHPQIAQDWHPDRNGFLTPADVTCDFRLAVWWRCAADPPHEWLDPIVDRVLQKRGCPYCEGRLVRAPRKP